MLENGKNRQEIWRSNTIRVEAETVASEKHSERNEDSYFHTDLADGTKVVGLFDGMGGRAGGAEASDLAVRTTFNELSQYKYSSVEEMKRGVELALQRAHLEIKRQDNGQRMGTTGVLMMIKNGERGFDVVIGSVGDSRVYKMCEDGELEPITLDDATYRHNNDEFDSRQIQNFLSRVSSVNQLPLFLREHFDKRHVTSAMLGASVAVSPNIYNLTAKPGEVFIATSDGIHDNLTDNEIQQIALKFKGNPTGLAKSLVEESKNRSRGHAERSKPDDMTAVAIELGSKLTNEKDSENVVEVGSKIRQFVKGEMVQIMGNNKILEQGWTVDGYDDQTGEVIVYRGNLQKYFSATELSKHNPEPDFSAIGRALSFRELYYTLTRFGGINADVFYKADEIIDVIEKIRKGQALINRVTRTHGLRQRVEDLLAIEKLRKK